MSQGALRIRRASLAAVVLVAGCRQDITAPLIPDSPLTPPLAQRTLTGASSIDIFPGAPGNGERGDARGLNATGQVTGALLELYGPPDAGAYRWTPGAGLVRLSGVCCGTAWGSDINDAGVVVGTSQTNFISGVRAYRAVGATMTRLDTLPGSSIEGDTRAYAINSAGQVAGDASNVSLQRHAVLWNAANHIRDLGTLGGSFSSATDINDAGTVIGTSYIAGDLVQHFFIWTSATGMHDLTLMLGTPTKLVGINDAGQIAGTFTTTSGDSHAFLYTPGSGVRDLGTLGGTISSATGLNDNGEVVGSSALTNGLTHAFFWSAASGMEDITAVTGIPDVHLLNDALQTVTGRSDFLNIAAPSPRLVQLAVSSGSGAPVARFTATCEARLCTFDASTSTDDKGIVSYQWVFGAVRSERKLVPVMSYTFPGTGSFEVTLTVTDADGHTNSVTHAVALSDRRA